MYSIVLTDGKIINIDATGLELNEEEKVITLIKYGRFVAILKMDNIAGLIDSDYVIIDKDTPKTGHWIYLKHNKARCSECDDVVLIAQMYGNANYCPNCGAKMVEQKESEDV